MEKERMNMWKSDVTSYSKKEYADMEKKLKKKLNNTLTSFQRKYSVKPFIEMDESKSKIKVFIINKAIHYLNIKD